MSPAPLRLRTLLIPQSGAAGSLIHPRMESLEESEVGHFERRICDGAGPVTFMLACSCNSLTAGRARSDSGLR